MSRKGPRLRLPEFFHHEAAGGVALGLAAVLAMLLANSPMAPRYTEMLHAHLTLGIAPLTLEKSVSHWINDGLMVIFFFVVGLEIKRELVVGQLSNAKRAALPFAGALGGMVVPALIYAAINRNDPHALHGWAIPCATDIAFAVGMLAALGSRVPASLKVFLLALAIIDDLGAIIVIALFYTAHLSVEALALAACGIAILATLNRAGVDRSWPYVLAGFFVWLCVLKSGVHATLAGVITAMAIPVTSPGRNGETEDAADRSLLGELQHTLHPWVTFAIVPLFALANAGVPLDGVTFETFESTIVMGIIAGLVVGKPVGIALFSWAAIASGLAEKPHNSNALQFVGIGALAGIGFTMSLFIGMLAFSSPTEATEIRLGVLTASLISAVLGYLILRYSGTISAGGSKV